MIFLINPIAFWVISNKRINEFQNKTINCFRQSHTQICEFKYPCSNNTKCHSIGLTLTPGLYQFELYGGSAGVFSNNGENGRVTSFMKENRTGCHYSDKEIKEKWKGNAECHIGGSNPGAGGYTRGIITLNQNTTAFLTMGGKGTNTFEYYYGITGGKMDENLRPPPAFNGGGRTGYYGFTGAAMYYTSTPSGGGGTDIRFDENDEFHRVIVAGGGGGADDAGSNDGYGGAGGGKIAQGFWVREGGNEAAPKYFGQYLATQTTGFSFFQGEGAIEGPSEVTGIGINSLVDKSSGGGGWYGGFSSQHHNGGSGGGSSFVLMKNAEIPKGNIKIYDDFHRFKKEGQYAFQNGEYYFDEEEHVPGIWEGNGMIRISYTPFSTAKFTQKKNIKNRHIHLFYMWGKISFLISGFQY